MQAMLLCMALTVGQNSPRTLEPPVPVYEPGPVVARGTWVYEPPVFDCYSRNRNWLNCYPGFHERHYRRPYNYRVLIDYPWHESLYGHVPMASGYMEGCTDCGPAEQVKRLTRTPMVARRPVNSSQPLDPVAAPLPPQRRALNAP